MRILATLTYYSPHISGLTVYARRLASRLTSRGHRVTVLTSRYSPGLPAREEIDGATVVRSPVLARVSKGVLMPLFPWHAARLVASHDVVHLHLPQFEAGLVAVLAKLFRKPVVVSYQCDIVLPSWRARLLFSWLIGLSHRITCALADSIVAISDDYADGSPLLRRFRHKVVSVHPPIELQPASGDGRELRERYNLGDGPLVGFVGRFAEEKGIDYLVGSVPLVLREVPDARYVMVGLSDRVPGERVHDRLRPKIDALGSRLVHIGVLTDAELSQFYRTVDVLVLPSINSTESFGMTQVEAMLAGTPVVATDIAGVREAVRITGMGELVPPRDERALAGAIVKVLRNRKRYERPEREIRELFDPQGTAAAYEKLCADLLRKRRPALVTEERSPTGVPSDDAGPSGGGAA
jgi:glycosyltransferase involved in cell wall biosynthesis